MLFRRDVAYAGGRSLVLLAPSQSQIPAHLRRVKVDQQVHSHYLASLQRLRGSQYLKDGAIGRWQLTADGRHTQAADSAAWHILAVDEEGEVTGCARYFPHSTSADFQDLGAGRSSQASCSVWGSRLASAVQNEMIDARNRGISYVELGGWAIREDLRRSADAIRIALGSYSLAGLLGGCLGITTATVRNQSSDILRRIGGRPLEVDGAAIPPYFDAQYGCQMEIIRFDSSQPNPKFRKCIEQIAHEMRGVPVYCMPGVVEQPMPEKKRSMPFLPMPYYGDVAIPA